jgi:ATP-binding cassette, subfamily B, multidrug efflux pump
VELKERVNTRITDYLKPYARAMSGGFAVKFLATIMDLLIPWILAYLIDGIVPQGRIPLIVLWGGMMILCSIASLAFNVLANHMAEKVASGVTAKMRHDLFSKISYLSCASIDRFTIPSVISRLTSDTYNIHKMISILQRMGVRAPILLIGGMIVTLSLDKVLALVLISMLPFVTAIVFLISRKGIPLYKSLQKQVDILVRTVRENIIGIRVIKALSKTEYEKQKFDKINEEVVQKEKKAAYTMAATAPSMNFLLSVGLILVILVGAFRVDSGLTQPGRIIAFLSYFTIILNAMLAVTRIFVIYSRGSASFQRVAEVLDARDDLVVHAPNPIREEAHISFNNVSFSYNKKQDDLENISFAINPGETLGIIGPTGSGKSSVIRLLLRFYDVDRGDIRIRGQNINSIPFDELHKKFGIVFQNDILFADTISENIDFGRGLDEKDIMAGAQFAQAGEFIEELDDRYAHRLEIRGANLSGGQRQRLLISRALAGKPEVLILDDSSSALDYKTDASLRKAIRDHYRQTTTIIVAQRISSVRHANRILVLEEGKAAGYGSHEELLKTCLAYRKIFELQTGGDIA